MIQLIRTAAVAFALLAPIGPVAYAQDATAQGDATLADLRAQLKTLAGDLQSLRSELRASGQVGYLVVGGDSFIDRMNAMETRMAALTGQAEQLQNQINRVVTDGTNRLGDIEFRLCEMDANCDLSTLTTPTDLGSIGGSASLPAPAPATPSPETGPAAGSAGATTADEQADFDRAREVLGQGDFRGAAELFAAIAETYAGGPLTAEALFLRGQALDSAGDSRAAAAAWLEGFAADPDSPHAAESLLGLSRVIGDQGDPLAACLYLAEIPVRFAGSNAAIEADRRMSVLNCGSAPLPVPDGVEGLDPEYGADMSEHG